MCVFFFSSRRRHTRYWRDWSSDVCSSDLELRLHCDADCAASLPSLPNMLELVREYDVVVGSRLAEGAQVGRRQRLRRRLAGRSFQQLCRLVLREPTTDLYFGFKLWRSHEADDLSPHAALQGRPSNR